MTPRRIPTLARKASRLTFRPPRKRGRPGAHRQGRCSLAQLPPRRSEREASPPPRRRRPVRYFSETATAIPLVFLSRPPAPTAWANTGQRFSNRWTQGQRMRGIKWTSPTVRLPPRRPQSSLRASRPSFRGRDGRRFRKPVARGCRSVQSSGNWESTEPPSRNT